MGNSTPASASLQFLGAAETVTGSKHLVTFGDKRVLREWLGHLILYSMTLWTGSARRQGAAVEG